MNENKRLKVWIIVLCCLLSLFAGYIFYLEYNVNSNNIQENKVETKEEVTNNSDKKNEEADGQKETNKISEDENIKLVSWVEYILNQNITKSYIYVWGETKNGNFYEKNVNLSDDDLKYILSNFSKGNITKEYFSGMGDTNSDIIISYIANDNATYQLTFKNGKILICNKENEDIDTWDIELLNLLEAENYSEAGIKDEENYYVSFTSDWDSSIYLNKFVN